jgi:hypothetical protein
LIPDADAAILRAVIRLTDAQLDAVMAAAQPLAPGNRGPFLEAVAMALQGRELGDGILHRVIAEVQRKFWDPPLVTAGGKRG